MKGLFDMLQAIMLVLIAGVIIMITPLIGLILTIIIAIVVVYFIIKENKEFPPD